jgi:hypothetical protein
VRRAAPAVFGSALRRSALILAALLASFALPSAGCRDETAGPAESTPPRISLPPNALYRFTTWQLDRNGGKIPGTDRQRRWTVLSTDTSVLGYDDVTLVGDSSADEPGTIAFRFTPGGDIYQYGYLADLVQKLEGRTIARRWDLIVAYSKGWLASWTVGILDSAGAQTMTGSSSEEELFFTVTTNGVSTIAAAYPVVLTSRSMESVLWVSENPPAFIRLREERFPPLGGRPGALREATAVTLP